jgi:hypothetical protein
MTTLRQAAEQLLEAFDDYPQQMWYIGEKLEALRQTLTEPEHEVVGAEFPQNWKGIDGAAAWHLIDRHSENWAQVGLHMNGWLKANQTTPPQREWVGLTDDEIAPIREKIQYENGIFILDHGDLWDFGRAIEAKLKEKNHG